MRELFWTKNAISKLRQHNLSENKIKNLIRNPDRIEYGIAPETMAFVKVLANRKSPFEIWVMVSSDDDVHKIISVWKYPGITKPNEALPFPLEELINL